MNVDKKPLTFMILAVLAILVGTLLTTFIPLFVGTVSPSTEKVIPYKTPGTGGQGHLHPRRMQ